jgi:DNA-binding XRE family transcriptional regulator
MDDIAIGRLFRLLRLRLGWRQEDVAAKAGIARSVYSEIERGHFDDLKLATLRRVAGVLEVRLELEAGWRGGRIERVLSGRHAAMAEVVTKMLVDAGWDVRPEASFSHFGERGVVDLVAWYPACRTFLLVEIKTELVNVNGLLEATDRRRRLADVIARDRGWAPEVVAQWVVLADGRTNQRRVTEHRSLLRSAFPADGRSIAGWLANPAAPIDALWFLPDVAGGSTGRSVSGPTRAATRKAASSGA